MSLAMVVDALADRLRSGLGASTMVGDARPVEPDGLPAVTLSIAGVDRALIGVGGIPHGARQGALRVQSTVDLADPVLRLDGDMVTLLSTDRRRLTLPHGQLVRADGTEDQPFGADDLTVTGPGGPIAVVEADPVGQQVRPDPTTGTLAFGDPLAAAGTLTAVYHLGRWSVRTVRFSGAVTIEVTAADAAAAAALSRRVGGVLDEVDGPFTRLLPTAWGAIGPAQALPDEAQSQLLSYRFDFEVEEPSLPTGGGLIRTVAVTSRTGGATETFAVTREGSTR